MAIFNPMADPPRPRRSARDWVVDSLVFSAGSDLIKCARNDCDRKYSTSRSSGQSAIPARAIWFGIRFTISAPR